MRFLLPSILLLASCSSGGAADAPAETAANEFRQCVMREAAQFGDRERVTGEQANAAFSACSSQLDRAANEIVKSDPGFNPGRDNRAFVSAAKTGLLAEMTNKVCDACLPPI